jgi:hypothetical protein
MKRWAFCLAAILAFAGVISQPAYPQQGSRVLSVNQILLLDGEQGVTLRYQVAQIVARPRMMGGVTRFLRVPNAAATQRVVSRQPTIFVALSGDVQPEAFARLIRLDARNGTREVAFDGRNFAPDHVVPIQLEPDPVLRAELPNAVVYRVTPSAPLPPGEYVFPGMAGNVFYDFGVD